MDSVWNDRFSSGGPEEAAETRPQGFLEGTKTKSSGPIAKYFEPTEADQDEMVIRVPDPVTVSMDELRNVTRPLDLELGQVATVEGRGIQRYLATTEDKVEFFLINPGALQMKATAIGTTVVHIWEVEGRVTLQIRVIPQKSIAQYVKRREERIERADSFKVEYTNNRSQYYQGNDFETLAQSSLAYSQGFKVTGDTPVGAFSGNAEIREIDNKPELSQISARISDFHYGAIEDADLSMIDTQMRTDMLILPQYRFRGVQWDHRPKKKPFIYTAFYGRELTSILGTLGTTGLGGGQETLDSYAGGGFVDYELNPAAKYRFGYVQAHGQSRVEDLNDMAFEFDQAYKVTDHFGVTTHTGYDSDHFSNRVAGTWRYPGLQFKSELRDTSKRFFTVVGNPGGQGEQGINSDLLWNISDSVNARFALDVYRDRQFFLPSEYDRFNTRQDASLQWRISSLSSLQADLKDYEETALISPYRTKSQALTYTQGIPIGDRRVSLYSRFSNDDTESLSNPESNYRRNTLGLGMQTLLFKDTYFSYQHNISLLEETLNHDVSHPRSMVYAISRRSRLADTPFTTDLTARYTDEEETESLRSFMIGEDRFELQGSVTYTLENMEFFLDGRYAAMRGENRINEARAEAEIVTGVRYLYDTGIRWEPQAKFFGAVYLDKNGDGRRQPEEAGVPGLIVRANGTEVTTDAQGNYQTPSIGGKRATIILDPNKIPYGHTVTGSLRRDVELAEAGKSVDFGLVSRSSIAGLVFNDLNGNGKYDPTDTAVGRVKVILDGKEQRVSDASGRFRFDEVATGPHAMTLDLKSLPIGYLPVGSIRKQLELSEGVQYRFDFAVTAERTVNGRVFVDANGNNHAEKEEAGVAKAKVRLGALEAEADDEGYYLFERVPAGTHTLTLVPGSAPGYTTDFAKDLTFTAAPAQRSEDLPVTVS